MSSGMTGSAFGTVIVLALGLIAGAGLFALTPKVTAEMHDVDFKVDIDNGTNVASKTFVLRGKLQAVQITVPPSFYGTATTVSPTGDVTITGNGYTLFEKDTIIADGTYFPRIKLQMTNGAAATFNAYPTALSSSITTNTIITYGGTNGLVATTNTVLTYNAVATGSAAAQSIFGDAPMAGQVTVQVHGKNVLMTNSVRFNVKLVYDR